MSIDPISTGLFDSWRWDFGWFNRWVQIIRLRWWTLAFISNYSLPSKFSRIANFALTKARLFRVHIVTSLISSFWTVQAGNLRIIGIIISGWPSRCSIVWASWTISKVSGTVIRILLLRFLYQILYFLRCRFTPSLQTLFDSGPISLFNGSSQLHKMLQQPSCEYFQAHLP